MSKKKSSSNTKLQKALGKWSESQGSTKGTALLRKDTFETPSGISIPPLSVSKPVESEEEYLDSLNFPGQYPYTRGIHPTMYRSKLWTMRQYAGFGGARETNERYRYLLSQGTTGLSVAFDLPTQMGRDSDDSLAAGEVGKVGVAIDSIEDMSLLFDGISLAEVSTSMTINATAHILLALYVAVAKQQGVALDAIRGTTQNDVLKEYIARGTYIYPPKEALKITTDIFAYCKAELPKWNTISVSGYHIREAGSDAAQEIAFTLANAVTYLEAATRSGLSVDDVAPRMTFFFNCHSNFLEEVAKFRAARRLWARVVKERWNPENPRSLLLRFHTQTAGSSLTAQQPQVNIVRTAYQALAAVLGGTQSLHTNGYDEALSLPSEESATLALRTQQLLATETGVADFVDPLGGSYAIEELTDALEEKARDYMEKIAEMGDMVSAIEANYPQRIIEETSYRTQQAIESGEQEIVGVNCYRELESKPATEAFLPKSSGEKIQIEQLEKLRARRDDARCKQTLSALSETAKNGGNIMPGVVECVTAEATVGEISNILRDVFGEYTP